MPRQRPLHRYPESYYALFERAQEDPFDLPCESPARARYIRADLYNLRANVRSTLQVDPDNAALAEQYILMENIVIELDDNVLHFRRRVYKNETAILDAVKKNSDIMDPEVWNK